jgi:hypothetical protein
VQALDHAAGYIMAAAAIRGLTWRLATGTGTSARAAILMTSLPATEATPFASIAPDDLLDEIEQTSWGPARRLRPPANIEGAPMRWDRPATQLGSAAANWAV